MHALLPGQLKEKELHMVLSLVRHCMLKSFYLFILHTSLENSDYNYIFKISDTLYGKIEFPKINCSLPDLYHGYFLILCNFK